MTAEQEKEKLLERRFRVLTVWKDTILGTRVTEVKYKATKDKAIEYARMKARIDRGPIKYVSTSIKEYVFVREVPVDF